MSDMSTQLRFEKFSSNSLNIYLRKVTMHDARSGDITVAIGLHKYLVHPKQNKTK